MREFWLLLKINIVTTFGLNKLKKKFAKNAVFLRVGLPIIVIFAGLLLLGLIFLYLYIYSAIFVQAELFAGILYFGFGIGAIFLLVTNLMQAGSYLFDAKDYDLLLALPLKPRNIIASKICGLLLLNYVSTLLFYLPTVIIYSIYASPSLRFFSFAILGFFLFPLVIITISSFLAYLINLVSFRIKRKNIFQTVIMIIVFIIVFIGAMMLSNSMTTLDGNDLNAIIQMAEQLKDVMMKMYYPDSWLITGLGGSLSNSLLFIGISIIPFIGFIYIVEKGFIKATARAKMTYTNPNFALKEEKGTSVTYSLLRREFKSLFNNANILLNTAIGPIMSTIMLVIFLLSPQGIVGELDLQEVPKDFILALMLLMVVFFSSLVTTTASSLSLEGKQFWILKSAPLAPSVIFKAKILVNLIIALPSIIINAIIISIVFKANILYLLIFIIFPLLNNIIGGGFGLFYNILFPRFDWDNPIKVVKQGVSVFLTMLNGFVVTVINVGAFIIITKYFNYTIAYIGVTIIMLGLLILIISLLKTIGIKKYETLQA